ncbi:hypothetical protein IFM89_018424 [Coptis chinensis]|uniref:RNase H type-1 domain-containing protein n=1 Tax=Coptis chinensis TaxID=261450 RepID=A0A835LFK6_9MAGN|nr:hypothetical protein IFM89_018424 [Coptis chinensis]
MVVVPFGLGGGRHQCLYPGSVLTPLPVVSGTFSTTNETPKDLSYAAAVKPRYGRNIDTSLLPSPGEQGGFPSIQLFDEDLEKGRDFCKQGLVGRLDLSKLKLDKVRSYVTNLWRLQGKEVVVDSTPDTILVDGMSKNQKKWWRRKNREVLVTETIVLDSSAEPADAQNEEIPIQVTESSTLILANNSTTLVPSISIIQGQCTTNNDRMENDSHAMLGLGVEELPIPPVNIEQNVSTNFHIVGSDSLIVPPPAALVAPFIGVQLGQSTPHPINSVVLHQNVSTNYDRIVDSNSPTLLAAEHTVSNIGVQVGQSTTPIPIQTYNNFSSLSSEEELALTVQHSAFHVSYAFTESWTNLVGNSMQTETGQKKKGIKKKGNFSLQHVLDLTDQELKGYNSKLSIIINGNDIIIPQPFMQLLASFGITPDISCNPQHNDYKVWCPDIKGKFSTKSAFNDTRKKKPIVLWSKLVWNSYTHPRVAATAWKLINGCAATDERVQKMGIRLASCCHFCSQSVESLHHILWQCTFAVQLWSWFSSCFQMSQPLINFQEASMLSSFWSPYLKQTWNSGLLAGMVAIWKHRNKIVFEGSTPNVDICKKAIRSHILCTDHLSKAHMDDTARDRHFCMFWNINFRIKPPPSLKSCFWIPPEPDIVKLNSDGASFGNPGPSGIGVTFRNFTGDFLITLHKNLGVSTSYKAECHAIVLGRKRRLHEVG